MVSIICAAITIAFFAILAWIILSYVVNFGRLSWDHPVRRIYTTLSRGIDPVLRPIRSVIPPLRIGGMGIDLSPIILFLGLNILQRIIC